MHRQKIRVKHLFCLAVIMMCLASRGALSIYSSSHISLAAASSTSLADRVLVVYNAEVLESLEVADHYISRRGIPESHKCAIAPPSTVSVTPEVFDSTVKTPIRNCLNTVGRNQILYIVFTYGTPYRLDDVPVGMELEQRALDQYIADIWDEYSSELTPWLLDHPYYAAAQSQGNVYQPFVSLADYRAQPTAKTIYAVWRLDAADVNLAKGLVDKAIQAETYGLSGQGCFDGQFGDSSHGTTLHDYSYLSGDWDVYKAATFARQANIPVTEDYHQAEFGTPPAPLRCDNAALYAGWYSLNNYNDVFTWNTGAIGFHLDSFSAGDPRGGENWAANALMRGITVTSGSVAEPYLSGLAHADGLYRNLFEGANVGDAFLRNTAYLKWMVLNMGDPLYRPFRGGLPPFNSPDYREAWLFIAPRFIIEGRPSAGIVNLANPAPPGGTTVTLTRTPAYAVSVPESVTVPEGETSAIFPITTDSGLHVSIASVAIIASHDETTIRNTLVLRTRYMGVHELGTCNTISGWAWDQNEPNTPISVDIYIDGILRARVLADIFRQELLDAGVGNGAHGFSYPTPADVRDGRMHDITVKFADTDLYLDNTGWLITCSGSIPSGINLPPTGRQGETIRQDTDLMLQTSENSRTPLHNSLEHMNRLVWNSHRARERKASR